jgi:DNA polymerase-3 subunit delta
VPVNVVDAGLAANNLVWIVIGDARLLVDRAVDKLVAWGKERCGPPAFNLAITHASDGDATAAIATARTLPMMAGLRVVVIRELDVASEELMQALVAYVAEPSPSTLFIACGESLPKTKKGGSNWGQRVPKAIEGKGRIVRFGAGDLAPAVFVREHARSLGKELGSSEAALLVGLVGVDLGRLAREVEKVALYVGDEPKIAADAIHAACSLVAEAVVWDLTTGIAARKPDLALAAAHRLLEDGDSAHRLLGLVVWQLRQVLQIAELRDRPPHVIKDLVGLRSEDQVHRVLRSLGKAPVDAARVLEQVARANEKMNSHRAGDRAVFEALVVELCR